MGIIRHPKPVKLISAIMAIDMQKLQESKTQLIQLFGNLDLESPVFPFDHTSYYVKEMGQHLIKQFVSFEYLIQVEAISHIKLTTNNIEIDLSETCQNETQICRKVNIDPGYITPAKLVLVTTKNYDHRIYIGQGIYAEVTLHYTKGKFRSWDWTYPDYTTELAMVFFTDVRKRYFQQLEEINLPKVETQNGGMDDLS